MKGNLQVHTFEAGQSKTVHVPRVLVQHIRVVVVRTEIGQYNEEIKPFNRVLQSLKSRLASIKKWLAEAIHKAAEIMKPEPYQPSVMEYIQVFQNLRRAGRADWGKQAKQTAGINDLKFAAQVQFFMEQNDILTLPDFEAFVGVIWARLFGRNKLRSSTLKHSNSSSLFLTRASKASASCESSMLKSTSRS